LSAHFRLFLYAPLRAGAAMASLLPGAELVGRATVPGTLQQTREGHPALVLAGNGSVVGEVWRCPAALLWRLDEHEGVAEGRVRRVGVRAGPYACWTYVVGARMVRRG
jgi:gamma-glutamylcyclotransferase (GGCT)/AIG2-like uncharacterized protein YtfP